MKSNLWEIPAERRVPAQRAPARRKSISAILRSAYRAAARDRLTRRAVKRVLR